MAEANYWSSEELRAAGYDPNDVRDRFDTHGHYVEWYPETDRLICDGKPVAGNDRNAFLHWLHDAMDESRRGGEA